MSTSPNGTSPQAPVGVKEGRLGGRLRRPGFCGDRRPEGRSLGQCACPSLLTLWIGCLQVMLDKGQDADWFSSTFIRVLATGAALGFIVFEPLPFGWIKAASNQLVISTPGVELQ